MKHVCHEIYFIVYGAGPLYITCTHVHSYLYIHSYIYIYTVQDDLLVREIFGEFVSEIQLADFILAILL